MKLAYFLITAVIFSFTSHATEAALPKAFLGETPNSPIQIDYSDWSLILKHTVIGAKGTARSRGKGLHSIKEAPTGSRLTRRNKRDTRNDGNRIDLRTLSKEANIADLVKIRKSLEAVPSEAPFNLWTKNEQLAYWLNLYNVALIEQLARKYPFRKLKKLKKAKKNNIWDQKLLTVSGIQLSLNDIQHKILPAKWNSSIVIYGLYQGYISGPSIQRTAYTGTNVHDLLRRSAREFVNSNRGMKPKGSTLRIAKFYEENAAFFASWKTDLKAHILEHSYRNIQADVQNTSKIKLMKSDYHTTDVYAGGKDIGTSYNNNIAALEFASVGAADTFGAAGELPNTAAMSSEDGYTSILTLMRDLNAREIENRRLPQATREYVIQMRMEEMKRQGNVRIEGVSPDEEKQEDPSR